MSRHSTVEYRSIKEKMKGLLLLDLVVRKLRDGWEWKVMYHEEMVARGTRTTKDAARRTGREEIEYRRKKMNEKISRLATKIRKEKVNVTDGMSDIDVLPEADVR